MAIIEAIVSQHAEEAAFLWLLRDAAVREPHYRLADLAHLDDRVEAHIDGLRVAGDEGWPFCAAGLEQQENGEVFAAAVLALEGQDPGRIERVYATVEAAPQTARGLVSALGWITPERLRGKVAGLLDARTPLWRKVGIAACATHRVDCGRHLTAAVEDPDPGLRARALRAAGETARTDLLPVLQRELTADAGEASFWAAWSAVLLGDRRDGVDALKRIAASRSPFAERALLLGLRAVDTRTAQDWLKTIAAAPERRRHLILGCAASGDPLYVPWLIKEMQTPELARIAGEAFSFITGVDIAYEDLEGEWPEGFEAGPTESPEDEDVAMDPDENLPWPEPGRIQAWWDANATRFQSATRYLAGQPVSEPHCREVLVSGYQRQRSAAALELALMRPEAPLFETRAPGFRQQQWLRRGRQGTSGA